MIDRFLKGWWPLLICAAAGAAAALGQAPWGLWYLALPAFGAGLWAVCHARTAWQAFGRAWTFGAAHFAVALHWITEPFFVEPEVTGWLAPFALVGLAGGLALFWGAAGGLGRIFGHRLGAIGVAVCFVLAEAARSYVLTGFPWALPGHVWVQSPALPLAAWLGPLGLTALVLLPASSLARGRYGVAIGVWACALGLGALVPAAPVDEGAQVVRLVQPNAPQHLKWQADMIPVFFQSALEATATQPQGRDPALVVWPETSLPVLLGRSEQARDFIARASGPAQVLVGAQRYGADGTPRNAAALLTPDGEISVVYDKHHLVPFGEYLPLAPVFDMLGVSALAAQLAGGYGAGAGPVVMEIDGLGQVFVMICYEAIFPHYIRQTPRADVIVHLTNDAWFGNFAGPAQHLALARLRAAEQGIGVLRAANTGVSAAIDARGGVVASLGMGLSGPLDVRVPPALAPTFYSRTGDLPLIVLLMVAGIGLFARRRAIGH